MQIILEKEEVAEFAKMFTAINEEIANLRRTVNAIHNELSVIRRENREAANEGATRAIREAATTARGASHQIPEVLSDTSMSMVASTSEEEGDSSEDDGDASEERPSENGSGGDGESTVGGEVSTEVEYSEEEKEAEHPQTDEDEDDFEVGDTVVFTDDATKSGKITRVSDSSVWVKIGRLKKPVIKRKHKVMKK